MENWTLWFKGPIEQDFGVFGGKNRILQTCKYMYISHADVNSGFLWPPVSLLQPHGLILKLRSASVFCASAETHLWLQYVSSGDRYVNIDAYF